MFELKIPPEQEPEYTWLFHWVFTERLGLNYRITRGTHPREVTLQKQSKTLILPGTFIEKHVRYGLKSDHIPEKIVLWEKENLPTAFVRRFPYDELPLLFGEAGYDTKNTQGRTRIKADLLGGIFFLLNGYDEHFARRDAHDRASAKNSFLSRFDILHRAVADEYVELLWHLIHDIWPETQRKTTKGSTQVTCDIDLPYFVGFKQFPRWSRLMLSCFLKQRDVVESAKIFKRGLGSSLGIRSWDPYEQFEWMMRINETAQNTVDFYVIADKTEKYLDGYYSLSETKIQRLLKDIARRGHRLGLHSSYNTYKHPTQQKKEVHIFKKVLQQLTIEMPTLKNRQHFLRWSEPETARGLEEAGIDVDSTLGFADMPGFRRGTCHAFSHFDMQTRSALHLRQQPLILMECSLLAKNPYTQTTLEKMLTYKKTCLHWGGVFTLLWHNSHFLYPEDKAFYQCLIQ